MRENYQITDTTGKVHWISRASAVAGLITGKKNGKYYVLLEQRGPGCPDNVGKWCAVCGYLNWGETRKDAVMRECYEETGYRPNPDKVIELQTIDDPERDPRENIVTRYIMLADIDDIGLGLAHEDINKFTEKRGGEPNEVSRIVLFSLDEIEAMNPDDFAFNHKDMIFEIIKEYEMKTLTGKIKWFIKDIFNK